MNTKIWTTVETRILLSTSVETTTTPNLFPYFWYYPVGLPLEPVLKIVSVRHWETTGRHISRVKPHTKVHKDNDSVLTVHHIPFNTPFNDRMSRLNMTGTSLLTI